MVRCDHTILRAPCRITSDVDIRHKKRIPELSGGSGNDILAGGDGIDTVDYSDAGGSVDVELTHSDWQITGAGGVDRLIDIENLRGSFSNDELEGNGGEQTKMRQP